MKEEEDDKVKGQVIAALLDTVALRINGNYINKPISDKLDSTKSNIRVSNDVDICSGMDGICSRSNECLNRIVRIKSPVSITFKFYILQTSPVDLIIGKPAIVQFHILDMFPIHFELSVTTPPITAHTQCTDCTHDTSNTIVNVITDVTDTETQTAAPSWLVHYIGQSLLSSLASMSQVRTQTSMSQMEI